MIDLKADAWAETPKPGEWWRSLSNEDRIRYASPEFSLLMTVKAATADGQVIVELNGAFPASKRGAILLDHEAHLKHYVDPALTVWLEPMGDRNSLRNLRGVEMK